ncbi:MAG: acetylxylan esterase [Candidatus Hydrogenedentes bacterium]|nr:acetylxylan esterase [Candidatus Hydrogenedentota bacterium]
MLAIISLMLSVAASPAVALPPANWAYAREFPEPGITVLQAGEYALWIWGTAESNVTLTVSGQALTVTIPPVDPKEEETKGKANWQRAGVFPFKTGRAEISPGPGVYAVALTPPDADSPAAFIRACRVSAAPEPVMDSRLTQRRHTDTVYTMPHYNLETWQSAAETIRRRMLVGCGLVDGWQESSSPVVVRDRVAAHDDYIVEKIRFEVFPGFWGTGNLYLPAQGKGPWPAILNPHGHWAHGRLEHSDSCSVPARCITFARMGAIALSIDMVGYNDSCQFNTHRWANETEKLWGIHPFALQLMTSLRAIDALRHLPEVDPERIGCTGASGGGTQTFALYTVDDRVRVAAPVNMISSTMQGGCVCENAPLIRLDHSNMEIGAMMAPRPLLMVAATGDWTRETPRVEFPAIRSIYDLFNARDNVESVQFNYGHNYNLDSRNAVYRFFGKHLIDPGKDWSNFQESPCQPEPENALRLFPDGKPPKDWADGRTLIERMIELRAKSVETRLAGNPADLSARWREPLRDTFAGARAPEVNEVRGDRLDRAVSTSWTVERWMIGRVGVGDRVPVLLYYTDPPDPRDTVILVDGRDKKSFLDSAGQPGPLVTALLEAGRAVMLVDPFLTGEYHAPNAPTRRQLVGAFLDTFEPTDTACRVQDILTAAAFARSRRDLTGRVSLAGWGTAGLWVLFAAALDEQITAVAVDLQGFPLDDDHAWARDCYAPSLRCLGDTRLAVALCAGRISLLAGWNGDATVARRFMKNLRQKSADPLEVVKSILETVPTL